MTKTEALKKFFKKFFDIDAHGWGTVSVLNDVIENNESLDGGGSGSSSGGGIMVIGLNTNNNPPTLDKTWQEIENYFSNGGIAKIVASDGPNFTFADIDIMIDGKIFAHSISNTGDIVQSTFTADSPNDYPVIDMDDDDDDNDGPKD